jgi:hypothetical protein
MEPAHLKLDWHSIRKQNVWSFGAWVSSSQVQEHDRAKARTDQMGMTPVNRSPNKLLQRTALRAAAEPGRYVDTI